MFIYIFATILLIASTNAGIIGTIGVGGLGGGYGIGGEISIGGHSGISLGGVHLGHEERVVDYHTPAKYEFQYGVVDPKTGDRKEQSEVREGDVVKGQYSVAEPDGTIRVVKYTADDHNGFNAVVTRIGHAAHPVLVQKAIPIAHHGIGLVGGY